LGKNWSEISKNQKTCKRFNFFPIELDFDTTNLIAICGDGDKKGTEQCDDGNLISGDGCNSTCGIELGWVCTDPGKPCKGN
jgi:cysteine-rich repeat protein